MKFLVLALCVCAASAASIAQPWQTAQRGAVTVANAVVAAPVVASQLIAEPVAKTAAKLLVGAEGAADILRHDNEITPNGFETSYETSNGIAAQSTGTLKKVGEDVFLVMQGSYQYANEDGSIVQVSYIADENGYQAKSDAIPVGPAIPEEILRSLEYIKNNPKKEN